MPRESWDAKIDELLSYPKNSFGEAPSRRWADLCSSLLTYHATPRKFSIEKHRKWELASALQKSLRRADEAAALHLISGVASMPEEFSYFMRRMCVIACEDVGPADDVLVKFVIACAATLATANSGSQKLKVLSFLAEQVCEVPSRSRIYCSFETVSGAAENNALPALTQEDKIILEAITCQKAGVQAGTTPLNEWQKRCNWRTAGLVKFIGLRLPFASRIDTRPCPASKTSFDLPSYCYDQYTRIGLAALWRLVQGVNGAEAIRDFFSRHCVKQAHRVMGEALFTVEGGREQSEEFYPALRSLEHRIYAHRFGLPFDEWLRLCELTLAAVEHGIVDRIREEVLRRQYGQRKLELVCQ